jgi:hypothetical protein
LPPAPLPHPPQPLSRPPQAPPATRPAAAHRPGSDDDKFIVQAPTPNEYSNHYNNSAPHPPRRSHEQVTAPTVTVTPPPARPGVSPPPPPPPPSASIQQRPPPSNSPPPLPPKTPLYASARPAVPGGMQAVLTRPPAGVSLPYPDNDGPPPVVNTARKPEYGVR